MLIEQTIPESGGAFPVRLGASAPLSPTPRNSAPYAAIKHAPGAGLLFKMDYFCDGSGWNGRRSRSCVAWGLTAEGSYVCSITTYEEPKTNNEMEYDAVIRALTMAKEGDTIYTDSQLVVNQVGGSYAVKAANLKALHMEAVSLRQSKGILVKWVPRGQNLAGRHLERAEIGR